LTVFILGGFILEEIFLFKIFPPLIRLFKKRKIICTFILAENFCIFFCGGCDSCFFIPYEHQRAKQTEQRERLRAKKSARIFRRGLGARMCQKGLKKDGKNGII